MIAIKSGRDLKAMREACVISARALKLAGEAVEPGVTTGEIDRRIRKNKTRLAKNLRADALVSSVPAEFDVVEDNDFDVIRTKRFAVKPMTTDEAILQMNLLDHSFYVFRSVETGNVCVVYRRNNGGYGLIETE